MQKLWTRYQSNHIWAFTDECDIYRFFIHVLLAIQGKTYTHKKVIKYHLNNNWRCRGIVVWPLDSHAESPGSIPTVTRYFCPSRHFIDIAALDQVYKWGPGRMRTVLWWVGMCAPVKWWLAGMLPREWRKSTLSAELILNPMTGVIIHCEALWSQ